MSNLKPVETHFALTDNELKYQFKNLTLAPHLFSHEAHLRLAWIQLKDHSLKQAIKNVSQQIKVFATHHGDSAKYNHTVTVAAIHIVNHFNRKSVANTFSDLLLEFPQLKTEFKALLGSHYSQNVFDIPEAKHQYIEPDICAFT